MPSKLILYGTDLSPPVRTVKIVAKLLGLEYEYRLVDLINGEHLKEKYLQINPEHTIPTLIDNGNTLWDSHSICAYLVDKYAENDTLYPKDLLLRAKCNQRMFFNASSLFVRLRDCSLSIFFKGYKDVSQEKIDAVNDGFNLLEAFLVTDSYLVGDKWTIADIAVSNTVLMLETYVPVTEDKHPQIFAWLARLHENIPHFEEINADWVNKYKEIVTLKLDENKCL